MNILIKLTSIVALIIAPHINVSDKAQAMNEIAPNAEVVNVVDHTSETGSH